MMIINDEVKNIISALSDEGGSVDENFIKLISALQKSCALNQDRYAQHPQSDAMSKPYPIDSEGYAVAFDPIEQEAEFWDAWSKYGVVVGKKIASEAQCNQTISRIHEIFNALSTDSCDLLNPKTYQNMPVDSEGTSLLSRGFFEIYHDDSLAQLRQNVRSYIHHVLIWGTPEIWTSFDRLGVKLPEHEGGRGLPLHVDQNPIIDPDFKTLQGVLALSNCPEERGTFRGVAGSRNVFQRYSEMADAKGEFVELDPNHPIAEELNSKAQALPLRMGDMVSWDSRTTHANTDNLSNDPRMVFYTAAGLAKENNSVAVAARMDVLKTGMASSPLKVPEALLRASLKPRYTNPEAIQDVRQAENFTLLGKLLYGTERYKDIVAPTAP